jgi:predicted Zn-dependent protease
VSTTTRAAPPNRKRRRARLFALLLLPALAVFGWWVYGQVQAWQHYRAAKADLDREQPGPAREKLRYCMKVWPASGEVRFLAAQAARRSGELGEAMRLLDEASERKWVSEAIDLERALLRAQAGEFHTVKNYLGVCLNEGHPDELLILEVITPIFLMNYELVHVANFLKRWLELRPESVAAWRYQGMLEEVRNNKIAAVEAFQEVVRLDPSGRNDRLSLAKALLRVNRHGEAVPLLEELTREDPEDVKMHQLLARAYYGVGRRDEARRLIIAVLDVFPVSSVALHLRGRLELDAGQPKRAAHFLQRALDREPCDHEILYTYMRCLNQLDRPKELEAIKKRHAQVEADLARVAALVRQVVAKPTDPEPRREVGEIFLRNGQDQEGVRWLESALDQQSNHPATHRVLADYYDRKGDLPRAKRHRLFAEPRGRPAEAAPEKKR